MNGLDDYYDICMYGHSLVVRVYPTARRRDHVCVNCGTVTKTEPILSRASDFKNGSA